MSGSGDEVSHARTIGRVPVRNLWWLLVYAYEAADFFDTNDAAAENASDLESLIGFLLADAVERRLWRNLSRRYVRREAVLRRVRGRIEVLKTYAHGLLDRGEIACRYEAFTDDTPRNRLVRRALIDIAQRIDEASLKRRCIDLSRRLASLGVGMPSSVPRATRQRVERHEREDAPMVTAARWVYELALPTEDRGEHRIRTPSRDEVLVRRLFELAVANFCRRHFRATEGWRVAPQRELHWQDRDSSEQLKTYLPRMRADVVIDWLPSGRRLIVETKFTHIVQKGRHDLKEKFRSPHIYQVYSYLRSQESIERTKANAGDRADALILYPSIDRVVDESALFHGHRIHFATLDLAAPAHMIGPRLKNLVARSF